MMTTEHTLLRKLNDLRLDMELQREAEIRRATQLQHQRQPEAAAYHTGLADGHNMALTGLRELIKEGEHNHGH